MRKFRLISFTFIFAFGFVLFYEMNVNKEELSNDSSRVNENTVTSTNITKLYSEMMKGSMPLDLEYDIIKEDSWKIPKSLHFLWIGRPMPQKYIRNIERFSKHNPTYQVRW